MFQILPRIALLAIPAVLVLSGCEDPGSGPADVKEIAAKNCPAPRPVPASNTEMAALLANLHQERSTSLEDQFVNSFRADHFGSLIALQTEPGKVLELRFHQADELVKAGRTQEAIGITEALVQQMDAGGLGLGPADRLMLLHLLGISYMRLGEQTNCVMDHTNASCVLPIAKAGQHKDQTGSRKAIEVYSRILTEFPDDLTARWLLNVASMTVGDHPDKVPAKWLVPEDAFGPKDGFPHFEDIATQVGVDVNGLSGGTCVEDFNNDGFLDVMVSGWSLTEQIRLFLSNGDGSFTERTKEAGLTGITGGLNMIHADYDNDGFADVLVLRGAWLMYGEQPNSLLHNLGDGGFEDVTKAAGMLAPHHTQTACWGDYDNDGDLDLFVGNESDKITLPCELFSNNGNGTFTNVAAQAGLALVGYVKGTAWGDVNNDGLLDLYMTDRTNGNKLFMNQGPNKAGVYTFIDNTRTAGVSLPKSAFPCWMWDYDNDGWLDLYVGCYPAPQLRNFAANVCASYLGKPFPAETPRLYHNNQNGTFRDVTSTAGLNLPLFAMGSNFGDLNNDGFLDMYLATGEPDLRSIIPNRMFLSEGNGHFRDVTVAGGFGNLQKGHGVAFGDLDNDGDQDLYVTMGGAFEGDVFHDLLFQNPGMGNHWTTLFLQGTTSARCAITARIRVTVSTPSGSRDIYARVGTGGSFGSSSLRQEIGLGDATAIQRIEVTWPRTNQKQVFENVPMDKAVKLVEGTAQYQLVDLPRVTLKAAEGQAPTHHHSM